MTAGTSSEMTAIVHELGSILSSLQGFAEIAEKRPDHPDRETFIAMIRQESRRAARAVKELQVLQALETGRLAERIEPVEMRSVLTLAGSMLADPHALDPAIEDVPESLPPVKCDERLFSDVLARCLDLASELGSAPSIQIVAGDHSVEVWVAFGPRALADELQRGLESAFGQARSLALIRRMVERWGGMVHVDSSDLESFVVLTLTYFDDADNPPAS